MGDILARAQASCKDSSIRAQYDRWTQRPLEGKKDSCLDKASSCKGRGYCLLQAGATIGREPYRMGKNLFIVFEKLFQFTRSFFEALFKEDGVTWKNVGTRGKQLLSAFVALFMRPITFALDLFKLLAGAIVNPKAAIKIEHQQSETKGEEELDLDPENNEKGDDDKLVEGEGEPKESEITEPKANVDQSQADPANTNANPSDSDSDEGDN